MEYKKLYAPEEIQDLIDWFSARQDRLPPELHLDKATYIRDLPHTVRLFLELTELLHENPTYSAQIHRFFCMRDRLIEEGVD